MPDSSSLLSTAPAPTERLLQALIRYGLALVPPVSSSHLFIPALCQPSSPRIGGGFTWTKQSRHERGTAGGDSMEATA